MRYDKLLEPVSNEEPCGPDLDETDDDEYLNYTMTAEERIPGRFFNSETGIPFDRSSITLKDEVKQISSLLERSRDIRLLCLEARFQILAGQITGFCECVLIIAGLVERYWDEVHPVGSDDNFTMRQNTLEILASRVTVLLPLQFAPLVLDKRHGPILYRDHIVSTGDVNARDGETNFDASTIAVVLSDSANEQSVTELHAILGSTLEALDAIKNRFSEKSDYEYTPDFSGLVDVLSGILKLLESNQPALVGGDVSDEEVNEEERIDDQSSSNSGGDSAANTSPASLSNGDLVDINNQQSARLALAAAESYFSANEPSSPALLLVHQARILVGKPLIEALQALLPQMAEKAVIKLNPSTSFQLGIETLRNLSQSTASSAGENAGDDVGTTHDVIAPVAKTRQDATALILAVESYFKKAEPSSPVPMLLTKARDYLSKDFSAIIADIIQAGENDQ